MQFASVQISLDRREKTISCKANIISFNVVFPARFGRLSRQNNRVLAIVSLMLWNGLCQMNLISSIIHSFRCPPVLLWTVQRKIRSVNKRPPGVTFSGLVSDARFRRVGVLNELADGCISARDICCGAVFRFNDQLPNLTAKADATRIMMASTVATSTNEFVMLIGGQAPSREDVP